MNPSWVSEVSTWSSDALENYIACADAEIDDRQRKLIFVRACLARKGASPSESTTNNTQEQ